MKFISTDDIYQRVDDRGKLIELSRGDWKQVNIIRVWAGQTVGGHYHKKRTELFHIVSGEILIREKGFNLLPGAIIIIEPGDMHTFTAVSDTVIVELLSEPFNEEDTWK